MFTSPTTQIWSPGAGLYLFHHVFLPPKLPQQDDYDTEYELVLLKSVIHALGKFKAHVPKCPGKIVASVIEMVSRLRDTHGSHGDVDEKKFKMALEKWTSTVSLSISFQRVFMLISPFRGVPANSHSLSKCCNLVY
jgi:hypothetical protein